MKDLNYWKKNAEENYITTPISVLKYIAELEVTQTPEQLRLCGVLKPLKDEVAISFIDYLKDFKERIIDNETFHETKTGLKNIEEMISMYEVYVVNF